MNIESKTTWIMDSETEIEVGDEVEITKKSGSVVKGKVTTLMNRYIGINIKYIPNEVCIDIEDIEEIEKV